MFEFGKTKATTVDGVLSAFRTAIDDLKAVASFQKQEADFQSTVIIKAQTLKESAELEAARAESVAAKMQAVFE